VVKTVDGSKSERPGILGDIATRLQEGLRATLQALGQSHAQRLAAIVESSDDAIVSVDLDGLVATWNGSAETLFGYTPEEVIGKPVAMLIPPDREGEEVELLDRVRAGERVDHYRTKRRRKDGSLVEVSLSLSPIKDSAGGIIGASKIARDVTEYERALESIARRMEEQAALYEFTDRLFRAKSAGEVYEAALDAIIRALRCERASILLFDETGIMKFVAWRGLSDTYRCAVEGHSPWTREAKDPLPLTVGDIDAADLEADLKSTVRGEGIGALAFIPLSIRGSLAGKFMAYYRATHVFGEEEIALAVTIARQLGFGIERMRAEEERRGAEEARELLLGESRHRIKNTLATVQALAAQTLNDSGTDQKAALLARLHALGEAHDLLTTENWDRALLADLVERALRPFRNEQADRILAEGPPVWVSASNSLLLTMCLHELATNAAKYGALSNGRGRVHVGWQASSGPDKKVKLFWRETGGPPVANPVRKGFGSRLIETSFGGQGGTAISYRPEGLKCLLELRP
jgi:PAS domain S-box-containing protein